MFWNIQKWNTLSSVLSLFLPLTDRILTGNLTGTTISATNILATNVSASTIAGSGENNYNLDYNKILYNKPNLNLYALKSNGSLNIINSTK